MSYQDNPGVNFSTLKFMGDSPLDYQYRLTHPTEPTPAMVKGSAFHCAVLQPDVFARDYAPNSDKEAGDQATRLSDKDYEDVINMSNRFRQRIGKLDGIPENPVYWTEPTTGIQCKGRLDLIQHGGGFIELKTISSVYANPDKFGWHCRRMQYDGQLAYYHDGLEYSGLIADPVTLIVIVQTPPYDVIEYDVPHYIIEDGRALYLKYLRKVDECRNNDQWPGRSGNGKLKLILPQRFESDSDDDGWE